MTDFHASFATEDDREALIALQASVGGGFATIEDFEHWYLEHPFGPVTIPTVRTGEGTIVGAAWIFPMRVSVYGEDVSIAQGANLHVLPDVRNTFAYAVLTRHLTRTLASLTPAHFSLVSCRTAEQRRRVRPESVTSIPWLVRVLDPDAWSQRLGHTGWRRLAAPVARAAARHSFGRRSAVNRAPVDVRIASHFDESFDVFWERLRNRDSVMLARSRDFLTWRFSGQRLRSYTVLVAESADRLSGYAVVRTRHEDGQKAGYIVDFVLADGEEGDRAGAALAEAAADYCRSAKVTAISTAVATESREASILRTAGFRSNPLHRLGRLQSLWSPPLCGAVVVHDTVKAPSQTHRIENWHLTLALHETI